MIYISRKAFYFVVGGVWWRAGIMDAILGDGADAEARVLCLELCHPKLIRCKKVQSAGGEASGEGVVAGSAAARRCF